MKDFNNFIHENKAQERTKEKIKREKESDKEKHDRMMDRARTLDTRRKNQQTEAVNPDDTGGAEETNMAVKQITAMRHYLDGIEKRVKDEGDMEEWFQNKLTKANDYLKTLYGYGKGDVAESIDEAKYSVDIDGIPRFYMDADSPAQVKMVLRKLLKKASDIDSVERVNDAAIKQDLRQRLKGAETDKRNVDEAKSAQDPDIKDRKGTQPAAYHKGLKKTTKAKRDAHFKKHGKKADDNPSAYKDAPGDKQARKEGMPKSKYTKFVDKMMDEEAIAEEGGFAEKSKKSGISVATLRKVYNRGVAAWKTGHRPGTTPQQWGHARVNAFIAKKKKGGLNHDKDLA